MPETFKIELTEDQVNMVAYALKEMGSKRAEQAIEWRKPELRTEADRHFKLAESVYQSLSVATAS